MKRKYSVGLLAAVLVCMAVFSGAYHYSYQQAKQKRQAEAEELRLKQEIEQKLSPVDSEKEESVETEGEASKAEGYCLLEKNGYIVVYTADKSAVYEYTNIAFATLPESVQEEIKAEKYIETIEELYGFLENYSS